MSTSPTSLPSLATLTTHLISSLSQIPISVVTTPPSLSTTTTLPNLLTSLPSASKSQAHHLLATLHVLYPHELIPALDILDRGLVLELISSSSSSPSKHNPISDPSPSRTETEATSPSTIYVRSASSSSTTNAGLRRTGGSGEEYYAVQLQAWNCSCAAFAFSAFGRSSSASTNNLDAVEPPGVPHHEEQPAGTSTSKTPESSSEGEWMFGGSLTQPSRGRGGQDEPGDVSEPALSTPVCKHILAAALAKYGGEVFKSGLQSLRVGAEEMAARAAGWWGE